MDMTPFTKVVEIGSSRDTGRVYVRITYALWSHGGEPDGVGRLSFMGVEGPLSTGNCRGGAGQINAHMDDEYLRALTINRLWERRYGTRARGEIRKFLNTWERWHLNDMRAGSPRQEAYKRSNPKRFAVTYPTSHYNNALAVLRDAGLNPDTEYIHNGEPYKYGTAWLHEDVPADVLDYLRDLPDAEHEPAWV